MMNPTPLSPTSQTVLSTGTVLPDQHSHKKANSAKCLINTKNMAYQDWLNIRKQGIGSSDAATACDLNPYMSMLELWMIKTGRQAQNLEDESSGLAPLYWGKQLEPLVAEYYSMHTNHKVRRVNAVLQHPDESLGANWENIRTIFSYPAEIRHAIYTTNAIESLNSVIHHSTKK